MIVSLLLTSTAAASLSATQLIQNQNWQGAAAVLERDISAQRDETVRALQRTCLGECRVKLHDDAAALDAFTEALGDDASLGAAALGRGRCLARLGRLTEASDALRTAASLGLGDAVVEAAACDVRGDDRARAVAWLEETASRDDARALLAVLRGRLEDPALAERSFLARYAFTGSTNAPRLERVAANAWCLHARAWDELDDKICLHDAIAGSGDAALRAAWPESHELPAALDGGAWVVKPRRGYGGAGVVLYDSGSDVPPNAQGLAQRYVPARLEGRAWSLRAYLIVRADGGYLSRIGVVRFALDGSIATNAARAVLAKGAPDERDVAWARRRLPGVWDARTWPRVRDAARGVARLARGEAPAWPGPTPPPKIVGLDFAVDEAGDAWLLEVNRTPGLVGRADVDRAVKDAVVDAAWGCSSADILEEFLL